MKEGIRREKYPHCRMSEDGLSNTKLKGKLYLYFIFLFAATATAVGVVCGFVMAKKVQNSKIFAKYGSLCLKEEYFLQISFSLSDIHHQKDFYFVFFVLVADSTSTEKIKNVLHVKLKEVFEEFDTFEDEHSRKIFKEFLK